MAIKEYIIGKKKPEGLALSALSIAGERAVIAQGAARYNAPVRNPYEDNIQGSTPDAPLYLSKLGTPVYADVTFESVTYTNTQGIEVTTPKMTFYSILVDVAFPRNVEKTTIQGRNGTVKEYIGEGDATITFRGVIVGDNGVYPEEEVLALKQVIKAPVSIPVVSKYLQMLDIDTIVFEDRNFAQEEGSYSYQAFTLSAVQDTPVELQII